MIWLENNTWKSKLSTTEKKNSFKMKLKYVDYGIGNRIGDTIYLHKKLKNHPRLHNQILQHEKKHSSDWNLNDFFLDFKNEEIQGVRKEYYGFVLTTPSSWINFLPITIIDGKMALDINITIVWIVMFLIFGILIGVTT